MTSSLAVKGRVSCYQFKCNYLKKQNHFSDFTAFLKSILNILKKNEPHSFGISEIIDSENVLT